MIYAWPLCAPVAVDDLVGAVKDHLAAARFPEARAAADRAFGEAPDAPEVREVYAAVYLAHGSRLSGEARNKRREEIQARGRPGEPFEDSDAVRAAFRDALAAFDRVLAAEPDHAKALALKAQLLFRVDRANRAQALAAYDRAVRALEATVPEGRARETGRKNLLRDRRRIEKPCDWCDDTGFCTECSGSGSRSLLGFRRRCDACLGHGICKKCGVL